MSNKPSIISYIELQNLYHRISELSHNYNGLMLPQLEREGVGKGERDLDLGFAEGDNDPQSTDTLQSLVRSCSCKNHRSHEDSVPSRGEGVHECKLHQPQERFRNLLMSYQKNVDIQNYYNRKPNQQEKEGKKQKKRIRWTEDLHKKFIECVDRLGGPKKATPKGIMKLMKCDGLTIFHVKSHLQKYRCTEVIHEEKEENSDQLGLKAGMQIVEALRLQMDVQQRLFHQLESQKNLQKRIEEQAKQLQTMLEYQQKNK